MPTKTAPVATALVWVVVNFFAPVHLLLFPQYSVFQITAAVSVPVVIPERKLFFDWGFQMNYDMPWNLESFYNVPIWPKKSKRRDVNNDSDYWRIPIDDIRQKYAINVDATNRQRHPNDFTAGELYMGLEDLLVSFGYHETCLLRSVCELARHPFDERHDNLLTQIVTFVFSPSLHEGFADSERVYRDAYEEAERRGFLRDECNKLYPDCQKDFLSLFTKIVFYNG